MTGRNKSAALITTIQTSVIANPTTKQANEGDNADPKTLPAGAVAEAQVVEEKVSVTGTQVGWRTQTMGRVKDPTSLHHRRPSMRHITPRNTPLGQVMANTDQHRLSLKQVTHNR